jgi:hypothetical protein
MGPAYPGGSYPAGFAGDYFFGDYVQGFLRRLRLGADDRLVAVEDFAAGFHGVDLATAPNGDLAYVDIGFASPDGGAVRQISYAPTNKTPLARADASPASGPAPLEVTFDATESLDPDGDELTYEWDFGDGSATADTAVARPRYETAGPYHVRLTVRDDEATHRRRRRSSGREGSSSTNRAIASRSRAARPTTATAPCAASRCAGR